MSEDPQEPKDAKESKKDTIYIDAEDEITGVIDKVENSKSDIVALVLPKKASTMQSTVNLRLLKRAAQTAGKRVVLITSDEAILPLAGAVGLHVATSLQSKPEIPPPPSSSDEGVVDDHSLPVGELAVRHAQEAPETIALDNEPEEKSDQPKKVGPPKDKKLVVPNFDRFRLMLFGGIGGFILLIIFLVFAIAVWPKVRVTVATTSTPLSSNINATTSGELKDVDVGNKVLPAAVQTKKTTQSQSVNATSQQNQGDKAKGTMTVFNCTDGDVTLPAGTAFTNSGLSFAAAQNVSVPASDFFSNGNCKKNKSASVAVTATQGGANYNLSAGRDYSSNFANSLTGNGSAMSGGTDKNVTVVGQGDVDKAVLAMSGLDAAGEADFTKQVEADGYYIFSGTLKHGDPTITATPAVGSQATTSTVSRELTFTALAVKKADLNKLLSAVLKDQIDPKKQKLANDDLIKDSVVQVNSQNGADRASLTITVNTSAVPIIASDELKKQLVGKKAGEIKAIVAPMPGVKTVDIKFSPFWVSKAPKKTSHILIIQQQVKD